MKKLGIVLLSVILILPCTMFLSSCAKKSFDKMMIKNWSNYKSIGAGFINKDSKKAAAAVCAGDSGFVAALSHSQNAGGIAASDPKAEPKLFGIKNDGTYEPIVFIDGNNKEEKQSLYLTGFSAFNSYIFVSYTAKASDHIRDFNEFREGRQMYVITANGKIYRLDNIFYNVLVYAEYESDTAILIRGQKNYSDEGGFYRISTAGEELKIEQIVSFSANLGLWRVMVDKYGNIFSGNIGNFELSFTGSDMIIKTDGTIHNLSLDSYMYKGLNGIMYCGSQEFNSAGELIDSEWTPDYPDGFVNISGIGIYQLNGKNNRLIKQSGNVCYYYLGSILYGNSDTMFDKVYKCTFDGGRYTVEIIMLEDYERIFVFANDRLYFQNNRQIYYADIDTGVKTVLTSDYIFQNIWPDNKGNICFSGVDNRLNNVEGTIGADDTVKVGITFNGYEVIYIKSIN